MWSYYGAKTNIIDCYPPPKFDKIIEPFAGTARYALKYYDRDIILVDKYEIVVKIWKWLQKCSSKDILNLPLPNRDQTTHNLKYDCQEAKWLIGFIITFGSFWPGTKTSKHFLQYRKNGISYSLNRIASDLHKIKHWIIKHDDYSILINEEATWFIDPPYKFGGYRYVESGRNIDYSELANWCASRDGQVIVCENEKATWMNFKPMSKQITKGGTQREAIWSNLPTAFDNEQILMDI